MKYVMDLEEEQESSLIILFLLTLHLVTVLTISFNQGFAFLLQQDFNLVIKENTYMKKNIITGLFILFIATLAFTQEKNEIIQKGIMFHNTAFQNGETDADKSLEYLRPYIEADQIACAYYGSALTIKASFYSDKDPLKALKLLEEGCNYIDKALTMDNQNIDVHCLRLINGLSISKSSPYKRYQIIEQDMEFLLQELVLSSCNTEVCSLIYLYSGELKIEQGYIDEALDLFDMAIEVCPESEYAKQAQKLLIKYGE